MWVYQVCILKPQICNETNICGACVASVPVRLREQVCETGAKSLCRVCDPTGRYCAGDLDGGGEIIGKQVPQEALRGMATQPLLHACRRNSPPSSSRLWSLTS
eukprot:s3841_g5.t1